MAVKTEWKCVSEKIPNGTGERKATVNQTLAISATHPTDHRSVSLTQETVQALGHTNGRPLAVKVWVSEDGHRIRLSRSKYHGVSVALNKFGGGHFMAPKAMRGALKHQGQIRSGLSRAGRYLSGDLVGV